MTRSKRFRPIQEIAAHSATALSRAVAESAQRVAELEGQRQQLTQYRDEYARQGLARGASVDAVKLQNYRTFLDRLGEALRQNEQKLQAAHAEHERAQAQWREKRIEAESLSRVVERYQSEERREQDRREQRDADETGLRISARTPD